MADPLHNLKNFLWQAWPILGIPVDPTPIQYEFCDYLTDTLAWNQIGEMAKAGDVGARKILMAFRGAAKSYVTTVFAVYRLYINRDEEVLVASATDKFAGAISTLAFNLIAQADWLADMKPRPDQRRSALAFDVNGAKVSKDESFAAASIFGQITGRRCTICIFDDVETPNTSSTETDRTRLRSRVSEIPGAVIKPGGDIYMLGTPQTEDTIYKEYAEEKGFELRIYPIRYPRRKEDFLALGESPADAAKHDELARYGGRLAPMLLKGLEENPLLAGTSTEPSRFSERDIAQRQQVWGSIEFDRQFNMFMDADKGKQRPLKLRDLIVMDIPPPSDAQPKLLLPTDIVWSTLSQHRLVDLEVDSLTGDSFLYGPAKVDVWVPAEEVSCWVDPSGEGKDETTWTIYGGQGARAFMLEQGASPEGHSEAVMLAIATDCKKWGVQVIEVESNFGMGMFSSLLRPQCEKVGLTCDIEDFRQGKVQKEQRIVSTYEPVTTGHRLVVNTEVFRKDFRSVESLVHIEQAKRRFYRWTYQYTRMTKQRGALPKDDRADGGAGGLRRYIERFQRTLDDTRNMGKERAMDAEIERIIQVRRESGLPLFGLDDKSQGEFGRGSGHKVPPRRPR